MSKHRLEIQINTEGHALAYLSPVGEDGQQESGFRIAGPKAWGGSKNLARLDISDDDLLTYIIEYAPHLIDRLPAYTVAESSESC